MPQPQSHSHVLFQFRSTEPSPLPVISAGAEAAGTLGSNRSLSASL
jgi:hypothetical protein